MTLSSMNSSAGVMIGGCSGRCNMHDPGTIQLETFKVPQRSRGMSKAKQRPLKVAQVRLLCCFYCHKRKCTS